jgi:hypothetical protein
VLFYVVLAGDARCDELPEQPELLGRETQRLVFGQPPEHLLIGDACPDAVLAEQFTAAPAVSLAVIGVRLPVTFSADIRQCTAPSGQPVIPVTPPGFRQCLRCGRPV